MLVDPLAKVTQLQGVHYRWKDEQKDKEKGQQIRLIAQELENVFPEVVLNAMAKSNP